MLIVAVFITGKKWKSPKFSLDNFLLKIFFIPFKTSQFSASLCLLPMPNLTVSISTRTPQVSKLHATGVLRVSLKGQNREDCLVYSWLIFIYKCSISDLPAIRHIQCLHCCGVAIQKVTDSPTSGYTSLG